MANATRVPIRALWTCARTPPALRLDGPRHRRSYIYAPFSTAPLLATGASAAIFYLLENDGRLP
ncbi:hypothetical protein HYPSUDRAFT_60541 [Hypholoma sublateritium FD-334 SS-4]|uniref:Uncharacterized protein n=1 Tax=Hypholoma sublateritium (strain FD-334 SS-4) TaxID=945553 RepID=A0A0D2LNS1_HYPSF|nr:hypothetical protein HYPSUDRAFT_60541 [Hypholoma sublateritium FD-334 SS-4]